MSYTVKHGEQKQQHHHVHQSNASYEGLLDQIDVDAIASGSDDNDPHAPDLHDGIVMQLLRRFNAEPPQELSGQDSAEDRSYCYSITALWRNRAQQSKRVDGMTQQWIQGYSPGIPNLKRSEHSACPSNCAVCNAVLELKERVRIT